MSGLARSVALFEGSENSGQVERHFADSAYAMRVAGLVPLDDCGIKYR